MEERLSDLGEAELLRRLAAWAPAGQFDDDAALLEERSGRLLVINTDVLVEGVHFSDATMDASDLGWRAAAANLSDLAAMGCRQVVGLTVGLVAPLATPWSWVAGVYDGLAEALQRYGGSLLGGDCCRGDQRLLAVTALGHVGEGPIRRSDGRPGDRLVSSGPHGLSRLGLALLRQESEVVAAGLEGTALAARAVASHRRPRPRFDAVAALEASRPAAVPWRVGGCDSSDGLLASVAAIAASSGCTALLDRQRLCLRRAAAPAEAAPSSQIWSASRRRTSSSSLSLSTAGTVISMWFLLTPDRARKRSFTRRNPPAATRLAGRTGFAVASAPIRFSPENSP